MFVSSLCFFFLEGYWKGIFSSPPTLSRHHRQSSKSFIVAVVVAWEFLVGSLLLCQKQALSFSSPSHPRRLSRLYRSTFVRFFYAHEAPTTRWSMVARRKSTQPRCSHHTINGPRIESCCQKHNQSQLMYFHNLSPILT
jgi:hypothetical protein